MVISECEDAIISVGFNQSSAGEVSPKTKKETRTSTCNLSRVFPQAAKRSTSPAPRPQTCRVCK